MGRRPPGTAKTQEKPHTPESSNPSMEGEKPQLEVKINSANLPSSKKKAKNQNAVVRRSERLHNVVLSVRHQNSEPVIEEIDASESEEEDAPQVHEEIKLAGPASGGRSLEDKIDYLFQLLETQQKTLEALMFKASERPIVSQGPSEANIGYKSLYIDSQKRIEALVEENHELCKKLEFAHGKLEVYEKGPCVVAEMLEKLKDAAVISNLTRTTETALNLSHHALVGGVFSPDAVVKPKTSPENRKRCAKEMEGKRPVKEGERKKPAEGSRRK